MITQITNVPANMVAFRATGEVTKDDFEIVKQESSKLVEATNNLNYMLVLDTSPSEFTAGAWLQDALLGIQNITKWNRAAIITDSQNIKNFTDVFSKVMPGEFRVYPNTDFDRAVEWVSEQTEDVAYSNF
jgi:hypothetical protein